MKKSLWILTVLTILVSLPVLGMAASPWTEKPTYQERAVSKLGLGLKNLILGPLELISVPVDKVRNGQGCVGTRLAEGIAQGIYNAVVYTAGGAFHTATFLITGWDIPLPNNGVNLS